MSTAPAILNKVKLLLKLTTSPNANEAAAAQAMADKLIAKYNITEEELASMEDKVFYGEDEKLFTTVGVDNWRQQLAVAISGYFDCQIVQEELVPLEGAHQFHYFVYGDDDQVKDTQFVYHAFVKRIDTLISIKCIGRGRVYIDSYCEGVVESIKWNIQMYGIDLPEIKKPLKQEQATPPTSNTLSKPSTEKEEPTDKRIDISKQSFIKDIMAYFRGVDDGKALSLQEIIELELKNQEAKRIPTTQEEVHEP